MEHNISSESLQFISLSKGYCIALENASKMEREEFIDAMLQLLPRLYTAAYNLKVNEMLEFEPYVDSLLDEDYYESIRRTIENIMGEDDVYLEVFEQDMKYSDTPVAASISEGLADIFQPLYNFVNTLHADSPDDAVDAALAAAREEFRSYWSAPLCNVLRALNHLRQWD